MPEAAKLKRFRSALKRHGGKYYLAPWIASLFPDHLTYIEPFFGAGSVMGTKPRSAVEIANDLDPDLMTFWRVFQSDPKRLIGQADSIPYNEGQFKAYKCVLETDLRNAVSEMSVALAYLVCNRFSREADSQTFGWSDRLRGGKPEYVNAWDTIRAWLPCVALRFAGVQFFNVPATQIIRRFDSDSAVIYCDPPYVRSTRVSKCSYGAFEMSDADHIALIETLKACKGTVFLSGYDSQLYRDRLSGWDSVSQAVANHSGQTKVKSRRTETVWSNRPIRKPDFAGFA